MQTTPKLNLGQPFPDEILFWRESWKRKCSYNYMRTAKVEPKQNIAGKNDLGVV